MAGNSRSRIRISKNGSWKNIRSRQWRRLRYRGRYPRACYFDWRFLFVYDTGQILSMLLFEDFIERFGQVQADGTKAFDYIISSLILSLISIGTLVGALSGAYTADWWGRHRSLSFGSLKFIIGNIIQITAMDSWVHLTMGRLVAGLGVGNLSVGVPMIQSECCPCEILGAVVTSYQLIITIGIWVSNEINMGVRSIKSIPASWRIGIGLEIGYSLPLGIGTLFSPESPRWLAGRGRWDEALMSFARLRGMKDKPLHTLVNNDFKEMQESNLAAAFLVCFFLPETKALALENVNFIYSDKSLKPWGSDK